MKPMIVVPPGTITKEDIARLDENGVLVVEAKDVAAVRFIDPIPVQSSRTEIEAAAIQLSRRLLRGDNFGGPNGMITWKDVNRMFVECLVKGTPLSEGPTQAEYEAKIVSQERESELRKIAREEARAERAAKKARDKKE